MLMEKTKVVFMYDFDGTLIKDSSEVSLIKKTFGVDNIMDWWNMVNTFARKHNMDPILATYHTLKTKLEEKNIPVTRDFFAQFGKDVKFFNGVTTWFDRINAYADSLGLEIDHYIISSGLKEILENTEIAQTVHLIVKKYVASVGVVIIKKKSAIQLNIQTPLPVSPRHSPIG